MPRATSVPAAAVMPCSMNQHKITSSSSLAAAGDRPGITVKSNLSDGEHQREALVG